MCVSRKTYGNVKFTTPSSLLRKLRAPPVATYEPPVTKKESHTSVAVMPRTSRFDRLGHGQEHGQTLSSRCHAFSPKLLFGDLFLRFFFHFLSCFFHMRAQICLVISCFLDILLYSCYKNPFFLFFAITVPCLLYFKPMEDQRLVIVLTFLICINLFINLYVYMPTLLQNLVQRE